MPSKAHDEAVFEILLESGLPGTKYAWPYKGAPALPWFTYKRARGGEFIADDSNYALMHRYQVDLYMAEPDDEVCESLEEALAKLGPFVCREVWNAVESCWIYSYTLTYHP